MTKDQILAGLPQPRLLRRPRLRRRGGRPALLQRERQEAHPRAVGAAGRPRPEPGPHRPDPLPRARPRPAATSSSTGCTASASSPPRSGRPPRPSRSRRCSRSSSPLSNCAASSEPYFCQYVMAYLLDDDNRSLDALGKTQPERLKAITQGGLTIQTTLDPDVQKMAYKELTKRVPVGNKALPRAKTDKSKAGLSERVGGAASIVEPGTGRIVAMVQNTKFPKTKKDNGVSYTEVNWNVDQKYGGTVGLAVRLDGQDVRHRRRAVERACRSTAPSRRSSPTPGPARSTRRPTAQDGCRPRARLGGPQRRVHRRPADPVQDGHGPLGQHRVRLAGPQPGHQERAEDDDDDGPAPRATASRSSATPRRSPSAPTTPRR